MDVHEFYHTFWKRTQELEEDDDRSLSQGEAQDGAQAAATPKSKTLIPKALELAFADPQTEQEREVKALIDAHTEAKATAVEQLFFEQRARLTTAEREIASREAAGKKVAKYLTNDVRVATNKMAQFKRWLDDLKRIDLKPEDNRSILACTRR